MAQQLPGIDEKTKNFVRYEGYLPYYWDSVTGKIWLEVNRLEQELLYITSLPAGLGSNDIGLDRGLLGGSEVVKFSRTGPRLLLTVPNYQYRASSANAAERRAVEQSFAQSVLWGWNIEAATGDRLLVDATDFLLRDAIQAGNRLRRSQQGNFSFDRSRSVFYLPRCRNFPQNTEIEATITLVNADGGAGALVQSVTPVAQAITMRMHHSFVQLPDAAYQSRPFDIRSGFIPQSYYDYSTAVSEPLVKYVAIRHRLQKKNPAAARSEAVKPIIYYVDNGTPEPIRTALMEGASWWNQAFEAAGYINAFQVKLLPDSADPMDIRYNVINWVHRSTRGWSYGASVTDPRTGEIIKGHVTLGSLRVRQDYLIATGLLAPYDDELPKDDNMLKLALARLRQLSAHEVGHTLGLMHNYASSVNNRASVMDYPHPQAQLNAAGTIELRDAYATGIGEWDKLAIAWGYQDYPAETTTSAALDALLRKGTETGLQFISDRDARAPGGLHPQAHLWDNGKDAVAELKAVMAVRAAALKRFGENTIPKATPMALLEDVLVPVYFYQRYQLEAVTKIIGGMNYTYAARGDGQLVTEPVSRLVQQKALQAILDCLQPAQLEIPDRIVRLIPPRPAGYGFSNELFEKHTGLAFDALSPAETTADFAFSFLFHPNRISRMAQYEVSGGMGVTEMIDRIIAASWKAPRQNALRGLIQQQTEQVLLTYLLSASVNESASFAARAAVQNGLEEIKTLISARLKNGTAGNQLAHYRLALERMKQPEKARPSIHAGIPMGAPIGCEE